MKAILIEKPGGPEVLQVVDLPKPAAAAGDVQVKVVAAGVNRADLLQRQGRYPPPAGASAVPGLEISGVLEEEAQGFPKGSPVMALLGGGAYAEYANVPAEHLMRVPAGLSMEEAAAVPEAFLTGYHNLFDLGGLQHGETVLIHAGASGVGIAAIQLAHMVGAQVIATVRSPEKVPACRAVGADTVIVVKESRFADQVMQETSGRGANLILDLIGASYWEENMKSLARRGRMALIGTLGGSSPTLNIGLAMSKRLRIEGSTLRGQTRDEKAGLVLRAAPVIEKGFAEGLFRANVDSVYPIELAAEAHRRMESNKNVGKIILRLAE